MLLLGDCGSLGLGLRLRMVMGCLVGMLLLMVALLLMKPGWFGLGILMLMGEHVLRGKHFCSFLLQMTAVIPRLWNFLVDRWLLYDEDQTNIGMALFLLCV